MMEENTNNNPKTEASCGCGSGSSCCEPKKPNKIMRIIFLVIIAGALGIIIYKFAAGKNEITKAPESAAMMKDSAACAKADSGKPSCGGAEDGGAPCCAKKTE